MSKIYLILFLLFSGNASASAEISIGSLYDHMLSQQRTHLKLLRHQGVDGVCKDCHS